MRLAVERTKDHVVLGPCPGCTLWTLEYDDQTAQSYYMIRVVDIEVEPVGSFPEIDTSPFHEVIEDALREHLEECAGLQSLLE